MRANHQVLATVRKRRALTQFLLLTGLTATPWIIMIAFGGLEEALDYRGWFLAALVSPICAYASAVWLKRAFANRSRVLSADDTHIHSSFFGSKRISDLERAYLEEKSVNLRGKTQFIVLDFGSYSKKFSAESILEPAEIVVAKVNALKGPIRPN